MPYTTIQALVKEMIGDAVSADPVGLADDIARAVPSNHLRTALRDILIGHIRTQFALQRRGVFNHTRDTTEAGTEEGAGSAPTTEAGPEFSAHNTPARPGTSPSASPSAQPGTQPAQRFASHRTRAIREDWTARRERLLSLPVKAAGEGYVFLRNATLADLLENVRMLRAHAHGTLQRADWFEHAAKVLEEAGTEEFGDLPDEILQEIEP